jgi:hypothetical protein
MHSRIHSIITGIMLACFLAACAIIDEPTVVPQGAERLNASEIRGLLAQPVVFDNDIKGGLTYSFAPDGSATFSMRALPARRKGEWRAGEEGLCVRVDKDPWECGPLFRLGNDRFYHYQPAYGNDYNTLILRK